MTTQTPAATKALTVTVPGPPQPWRTDRLLIVDDDDLGTVAVRWQLGGRPVWRCKACGPQDRADCAHSFAAALRLAEDLLGLTATTTEGTTS